MSPLWKVSAEECDYDQFDAFVIRAATEDDARRLANFGKHQGKITVERIDPDGPEEEILGSFNAG